MDDAWLEAVAASPWLLPALFLLVVGDAFLVILPSETLVVTLGTLWGATGRPPLWSVIPVAAVGAIVGDGLLFLIGQRVGLDRWGWQRRGRIAAAIARARTGVQRRPAVLILTARYIPFARIAVNLTAGASGLGMRRFLPLSAVAGTAWAVYNTVIGAFFGRTLREVPLLAVAVSVVVAVGLGVVIDVVADRVARRRAERATAPRDRPPG